MSQRQRNRFDPAADFHFGEHIADVRLDCRRADAKLCRNFSVAEALLHQDQHFSLSFCQAKLGSGTEVSGELIKACSASFARVG